MREVDEHDAEDYKEEVELCESIARRNLAIIKEFDLKSKPRRSVKPESRFGFRRSKLNFELHWPHTS